jgi:outer membrane protein TolC
MVIASTTLFFAGCASVDIERGVANVNREFRDFTGGDLRLSRAVAVDEKALSSLLDQLVTQELAVRIALMHSPVFQVILNEYWGNAAGAMQAARLPNPVFAFERLRGGDELEIGRLLSIGIIDLLSLPQRRKIATQRRLAEEWKLSGEVVEKITKVRKSWVRAVAAQQTAEYAEQVFESAEASAELARRMEAAGNFNRITRARQQAFHADATAQLTVARQESLARREELIRELGLDDDAAKKLVLPSTLPSLPDAALSAEEVGQLAKTARLDLQWARYQFESARAAQGLTAITSWIDVEGAGRRDSIFDNSSGTRETVRGYEVELRLPVFDIGDLERAAMNAETMAAFNRYESVRRAAGSHLREHYAAYKTAHDLAIHHRDEIVPLRKTISEENLLRYNGMLIGVFELLADSREQISAVMSSIAAQQQFWLADAALRASVVGRPQGVEIMAPRGAVNTDRGGGH